MLEALVSLPLLSFFALPMMSSYSTSLNLLFFWMTWSTLVLSHKPLHVELFGSLMVRVVFYLLPNSLFFAFDVLVPSLSKATKAQGNVALPLQYGRRRLTGIVAVSIFNTLLSIAMGAGVEFLLTDVLRIQSALKIATRLPLPWSIVIDLARGFALRGTLQYYIHRHLLHNQRYGGILTRWHLGWAHSINSPFPFTASYDHPIPYIFHNFLPLYLPAMLFRFHIITFYVMLILVSMEEVFTHSGYSVLPSSIILPGMARRKEMHFMSKGKGNYAPVGLMDWASGTACAESADFADDIGEEMEKHEVKRRANSAANSIGDFIQDVGSKTKKKGGKGKK